MATTTTSSANVVTEYLEEFYSEFVRKNLFSNYTGTGVNNPIVIKSGRKTVSIPLVTRLKSAGVSGSSTLRGNGEAIGDYAATLTPTYKRNAVEFTKEEMEKPAYDLMVAARPLLMDWAMAKVRDEIIEAMGAIHTGSAYVNYGSATAANRNAWAVANSDRIVYGSVLSNYSGVHATDLAKCDTTADTTTASLISLLKRLAKNADPKIRPIRVEDGSEWFVAFMDSFAFRDLQTSMSTVHQNALPRSESNILFRDGDITTNGVICREIPEIGSFIDSATGNWVSLKTAGASSARVTPIFLCGAQALGYGMGQKPSVVVDTTYDYGFQPGVAVELKHDIDKMFFNSKQHGIVTGFVAASSD